LNLNFSDKDPVLLSLKYDVRNTSFKTFFWFSGYNFKTHFEGHVVLSNTFILCIIYAATAQLLRLFVLFKLQFLKQITSQSGRIAEL
jgi:hypothetical protein